MGAESDRSHGADQGVDHDREEHKEHSEFRTMYNEQRKGQVCYKRCDGDFF